jgi:hypothetical protein
LTTIVWKDGLLATDSRVNQDTIPLKGSYKLIHTDTHAYALSGNLVEALTFVDWVEDSPPDAVKPPVDGFSILKMNKVTGRAWCIEGGYDLPIEDKFFCLGSGGEVARGALEVGATVQQAMRAAIRWDTASGGPIQYVKSKAYKQSLKETS